MFDMLDEESVDSVIEEEETKPPARPHNGGEPTPVGEPLSPVVLIGSVAPTEAAKDPSPKPRMSVTSQPTERKPRMLPSALRRHEQRLVVRRAMICQLPGINRVRAEAIVNKYPTLRALMNATERELALLPIKKSPLGLELAVAIKRVFG